MPFEENFISSTQVPNFAAFHEPLPKRPANQLFAVQGHEPPPSREKDLFVPSSSSFHRLPDSPPERQRMREHGNQEHFIVIGRVDLLVITWVFIFGILVGRLGK